MSGWYSTTLGQICADGGGEIQTGPFGSQLHASDYVDEGTPVVMPQNIKDNFVDPEGIARISEADLKRLERYQLLQGDIVYSRRGDVERRALVRSENTGWLCGTGCLRVRLGDDRAHDPTFVSYALGLKRTREWIVRHAVGATMLNLNTSILSAVPLSVPRVDQQRAIAEVLGALDDKIAANTGLSASAEDLILALARRGETRCILADVATRATKSVKPEALGDAQVDHFSLPAYDGDRTAEAASADSIKSSKFALELPCVLLSKLNPRIPRIWDVVVLSGRPSLSSTEFIVLQPEQVSSSVLWAVLSQPNFMVELKGMVAGTSGSHQRVRPDDVMALEVTDPRFLSNETQAAIRALGQAVAHVRQENEELARTRDALLPLLMSGKVTVKDAEAMVGEVV
ncbi:restriction endonuclease subunit S [Janibacter indicus]|uniref:Restriction endonuclease subunit S n=1 Tax=Janibacter indicus TaxID=857417 RepID=A0A7L9J4Q0_9MICO|nr:restriction endonuclease subunit S [Janibacter indicus]QOK23975.1 restriction endonuclease subunit S [Janibacter indicus]